ncbi:MAG: glycosyltransferase [Candidatus Cloacimonetes bacterium]|nr:glycosyltransferase [Candidatus Cloacimonadota bacterium]MCF7884800.1 glycosyltransferase [Candidatus Cloacimonadota bacterium]
MKPDATIFIPTKNAGPEFRIVLKKICDQQEKNIEIIILDSGSTDETLEIARSFPVKLHEIKPVEFGHGKTRNLALEYAKADFIVFLSQDAIPFDEFWLSCLLRNFDDLEVVGVFSRQIPRQNSKEVQRFFYQYYFPNKKIIRPQSEFNSSQNRFFSNVSSCIRKDVLQKYPFDETILTSEDQDWAMRVIQLGFKTFYEPDSLVIHSHDHNLKQALFSFKWVNSIY